MALLNSGLYTSIHANFIFTTDLVGSNMEEGTIVLLSGSNLPESALAERCGNSQNCEYIACIVTMASTIVKISRA